MSEVETGSCYRFFEWLMVGLATFFIIINEIIEELPKLITLAAFLITLIIWILSSFYILLNSFNKKKLQAFLNYRVESGFLGIHILWPPIWCFYILIGVCILFWLSSDLMELMN